MAGGTVHVFKSLHLWDICALIASSRAFCGSSLHVCIVAAAYGLPHVILISPRQRNRPGKVAAYLETWEPKALALGVGANEVEDALIAALLEIGNLDNIADLLARLYKQNQQQWISKLVLWDNGFDVG